jgi:DNA-binding MarR family transcriptional regulator
MKPAPRPHAAPDAAEPPPGLSYGRLPEILGFHLRRAQLALFRHFARTVGAAEDITPGLLGMLQVIAANPGLGQSRLAETMEVDRSTIVKVVDQLEGRGLIRRDPSPTDKRSHCLHLTPQGAETLARIEERVRAHEDEFTRCLTEDERHFLTRLLARLHQADDAARGDR